MSDTCTLINNQSVNETRGDEKLNKSAVFSVGIDEEVTSQNEAKRRMPSDLQLKLEKQLQKSRQARANKPYYANKLTEKEYQQTEIVPLILNDRSVNQNDSYQFKDVVFQQPLSSYQNYSSDCSDQLMKDGFRLDELTDDEDLDLLPHPTVRSTTWCSCKNISYFLDNIMASNIPNNYTQRCRYFKLEGFCKHMENCKFRHDNKIDISLQSKRKESEETNAYDNDNEKSNEKSFKIQKVTFAKNNKLCRYFKLDNSCKMGEMCKYAHISNSPELNAENLPQKTPRIKKNLVSSKKENKYAELSEEINRAEGLTVDKEILQNCKHFMSKKGCKHGNKCTFKHYRSTSDAADETIVTTYVESISSEAFRAQDLHPINDVLMDDKVRIIKTNDNNPFSVNSEKVNESFLENRSPSVKMCNRSYNEKSCYKNNKYQFKDNSSKPLVEQTSLELAVQEEADVEALVTAAVSNCKLEENFFKEKFKDDKVCPFFLKNQICSKGDTCDLLHPDNAESYDMQDINKIMKDVTNISKNNNEKLLNHRKLCKFFLSESGCRRKDLCKYLHEDVKVKNFQTLETNSVDNRISGEKFPIKRFGYYENTLVSPALQLNNVKSLENLVDFKKLRSTELQQLEKRFKNKFQWSTSESSDIYIVSIEPSDPDWPFIVKSFNLSFSFPKDYPQELFKVTLENKNGEYPDGFAEFMGDNLQDWLEKRNEERSETDLAFRPFIRWFDRNLETLFTSSATKVKRQQDAMRAGITLIPYHKILKNSQTVSTSLESTPQSLITNGAANSDPSIVLEDKAVDGVNIFQKTNSGTDNNTFTSVQVKKGTEIKFAGMLIVNVGTLKLTDLALTIQCDRCKLKADVKLKDQVSLAISCKKCNTIQAVAFYSELMHQYSNVAGYLHLNGCKVFELILSDSIIILNCFKCAKDNLLKGITYGSVRHHWCISCHEKMDIEVPATQFHVLQPAGLSVLDVKLKPPSKLKVIRDPSVKDGEPLPENGTCRHYKKSYRWLRFPCCGKLFPCDKCHEESSNDGHEMLFATKMLCGFCAKEQPFSKDKPCVRCASNTTRSRSSHWEGGKGCRDAVKMARGDKRKSAGLGKTIPRKHNVDNSK